MLSAFFLLAQANLKSQEMIVPAGTILQCTLEDANLSSKTAILNDPILCDAGSLREFDVPAFPSGAYLEGRFAAAREPGHLWGKGWIQLQFDQVLLPDGELPISVRVTSAPNLKVDRQGKIHGTGHAGRDAVEWAIPVLWPEKILTLPNRGPRPELKGEAQIRLKLMESISVPQEAAPYHAQAAPIGLGASADDRSAYPLAAAPVLQQVSLITTTGPDRASTEGTLLIFRDGSAELAKDYWFDSGQKVQFISAAGKTGVVPIEALDLGATVKLNRERGVAFVIRSK